MKQRYFDKNELNLKCTHACECSKTSKVHDSLALKWFALRIAAFSFAVPYLMRVMDAR